MRASRWIERLPSLLTACTAAIAVTLGCGSDDDDHFGNGGGRGPGAGNGDGEGGEVFFGTPGANGNGTGASGDNGGGVSGFTDRRSIGDCVADVSQGEKRPLDLYIMFDRSGSMTCSIPSGGTRWDAVKDALIRFVNDPGAAGIGVGLGYFGTDFPFVPGSSCDPADYERPEVPIALLPGNAAAIAGSLDAQQPFTDTPSAPALSGAVNHAIAWRDNHPSHGVAVVFVTDGQPNQCGTVDDVEHVARTAWEQAGMATYVIGVISPGVDCGILDPNPPNELDLHRVAAAGGTEQALMVDTTGDPAAQFLDRMDQIRTSAQIPCEFQIPDPPEGDRIDHGAVNVEYVPPGGSPSLVYHVGDRGGCDPAEGGWHYDDQNNPTRILLCPATCDAVETQINARLDIALGCETRDIVR